MKLSKEIEQVPAASAEEIEKMGPEELLAQIGLFTMALIGILKVVKAFTGPKADKGIDRYILLIKRAQEFTNKDLPL